MATTSGYAGATTTEVYGTHDWADPAEAIGANDSTTADVSIAATISSLPNEIKSYFLLCSGFGLTVGSVSVRVSAVTAVIRARSTSDVPVGNSKLTAALYLPDGTQSAFATVQTMDQDNSFDNYTFGGDLWGLSSGQLLFGVIEHSSFGVRVLFENNQTVPSNTATCGVDSVQMVVTYELTNDEPPPPFADDEEIKLVTQRFKRRFYI